MAQKDLIFYSKYVIIYGVCEFYLRQYKAYSIKICEQNMRKKRKIMEDLWKKEVHLQVK